MNHRDPDVLRRLYHDEEMSTNEIADELGCTQATVSRWMKHHGIETRGNWPHDYVTDDDAADSSYRDREWLRKKYVDENMWPREIAAEAGVSKGTVTLWLNRHCILQRRDEL